MITNAADTNLDQLSGGLPQMRDTLTDWFQKVVFTRVTKSQVDFDTSETKEEIEFLGVVQPTNAQKLSLKPEGQRAWDWKTVHAVPDLILANDEIISYQGVEYRIMNRWQWQAYGFVEYEMVESFRVANE